jgi:hypothetical protein
MPASDLFRGSVRPSLGTGGGSVASEPYELRFDRVPLPITEDLRLSPAPGKVETLCLDFTRFVLAPQQQLFNIPVAETELVIQPDAVAYDFGREAVVLVAVS